MSKDVNASPHFKNIFINSINIIKMYLEIGKSGFSVRRNRIATKALRHKGKIRVIEKKEVFTAEAAVAPEEKILPGFKSLKLTNF